MSAREAAAYFVARRGEGLTSSEQELLEAWLEQDDSHAEALERVERAWTWTGDAEGHEIIQAMREHAAATPSRRWTVPGTAAAAVAAILLVVLAGLIVRTTGAPTPEAIVTTYDSPGQVRTFLLGDGSRITLDAGSRLVTRFDQSERAATLVRGRALFAVASDAARPFSVAAGERRIVAVGTRFESSLGPRTLTVTLFEGQVRVEPLGGGSALVALMPGQKFVETEGRARILRLGERVEDETSWARGLLHFDDVTLDEAVAQVNRYSSVQVTIRDRHVAAMRISGEFRAGDAERFAVTVAELRPLRLVRRPAEIELVRR